MLTRKHLYEISRARFREAKLLFATEPDGAVHLCGYALELILKMKIVEKLNWDGFPETSKEFEPYKSFKSHDLEVLLHLSGHEKTLNADSSMQAKWKVAQAWDSETRYRPIGTITPVQAKEILEATLDVIKFLIVLK